ncbi:MAG: hypothetical protein NT068_02860 [Candidatus Nomurabacteria bacterium]|nr:hypothetical protein [Candidatus Nomurabacteria bacterium]
MKYKKQITTSVLALSLLMVSSSAFAATNVVPQGATVNHVETKAKETTHAKTKVTGVVSVVSADGASFTVTVKNRKTNTTTSFDVQTTAATKFTKDGKLATMADVALNTKVIVSGKVDSTANTISANKVRLVTKKVAMNPSKESKIDKTKTN